MGRHIQGSGVRRSLGEHHHVLVLVFDDSLLTVENARFHGGASPKQVVLVKKDRDTDFDGVSINEPLRSNAGAGIDIR